MNPYVIIARVTGRYLLPIVRKAVYKAVRKKLVSAPSRIIRLLPSLRRIAWTAANKGLRTTIKRQALVKAEYAKRLLQPSTRKDTILKLLNRQTKSSIKKFFRASKANVKRAKQAYKGKGISTNYKKLFEKPKKKNLLSKVAMDVVALPGTAYTVHKAVQQDKNKVANEIDRRAQQITKPQQQLKEASRTAGVTPSTSTGGIIFVKGHYRDGVWIDSYTRRAG